MLASLRGHSEANFESVERHFQIRLDPIAAVKVKAPGWDDTELKEKQTSQCHVLTSSFL